MATAVDLRAMARTTEVVNHGFTISSDIRNVTAHYNLLKNSQIRAKDVGKMELCEKTFSVCSEEQLKVYDTYKNVVGFAKARDLMASLTLRDESENKISIKTPYTNKNKTAFVKYVTAVMTYITISKDNVHLSDHAKHKLHEIDGAHSAQPDDAQLLMKQFLTECGSHFHGGQIQHGGVFEWAVTWENDPDNESDNEQIAKELLESSSSLKGSNKGIWYQGDQVMKEDYERFTELKSFRVRVTKLGGSDDIGDYKTWDTHMDKKKGDKILVEGDSLFPVWKLVEDRKENVSNGSTLAKRLQKVWNEDVKNMLPSQKDSLIELLGLLPYQDVGISIENARVLTLSQEGIHGKKLEDIPWMIIEKWMRVDRTCRDHTTIKAVLDMNKKQITGKLSCHPMDVFLVIFTHCDLLLRQLLVQKLAGCRLAIPFIIPCDDNSLQVSLWALRSVIIEWSDNNESKEASLVKQPVKIVGCVRIGELTSSKSKLLNDMMSMAHRDTFFHRDASAGNKRRCASNGCVELSYFLPRNGSEPFSEAIIFLNLRGDGQEYPEQCKLLSKLASVMLCVSEIDTLEKDQTFQMLSSIQAECSNVTALLVSSAALNTNEERHVKKLQDKGFKVLKGYDDDGAIAEADLAQDAAVSVAKSLAASRTKATPLQGQIAVFKEIGVQFDEDGTCIQSELDRPVRNIVQQIKRKDISKAKHDMLPLQAEVLHNLTRLLKKQHREIKEVNIEETMKKKSKIADDMKELRKQQLKKCKPLGSILKTFIEAQLDCYPSLGHKLFFKLLKLELDDISRNVLPILRQSYQDAWNRKQQDPSGWRQAERLLDQSSFGQEHLFREMGQLYECLQLFQDNLSPEQMCLLPKLPFLAAAYFLSGHPIEIMDGDSGVVPLTWVHAILDSLHQMIDDKRMFVLSVVGVQSSGKSTLLNAMFGLELAVGAGRCTRGIYAQLLLVDKETSNLTVDYILVLDSEGLCGTKQDGKAEHDNEIATLVIGLADLTIVNIKGENTEQMKDIFDIAVHAFLRMKAVQKYKKQKCIFLHQSVSAAGAVPQLMRDRHTLQQHLDEMTQNAADVENMSHTINKFHHVIDFDCDKDVFYIPDLWDGVPPMARVSSGYSDKIKAVRCHILKDVSLSECSITAKDMEIRLEDMWNGVLADDFLFSFKNNLVLKAYLMLETKFYELTRHYESTLLQFIEDKCKVEIEKVEDTTGLATCFAAEKKKLQLKQSEVLGDCEKELKEFFHKSNVREHIIPWKDAKLQEINMTLKQMGDQFCHDLKLLCDIREFECNNIESQKSSFVERTQSLAESMTNQKFNDKTLRQHFEQTWSIWTSEMNFDQTLQTYDVKKEIKKALEEILRTRGHTRFLKEEIADKGLFQDILPGSEDIEIASLKKEHLANKLFPGDISDTGKHWKGTDRVPKQPSRENYYTHVVETTNKLLAEVKHMLSTMMAENIKFMPALAHKVLIFIITEIDKHNALPTEQSDFSLTPTFEAMIAVHVARIASIRFEKMNEKFLKTLNHDAKLDSFQKKTCNLFVNTVHAKRNEAVADLLCDKIRPQIRDKMNSHMTIKVIDTILQKIQYKKHSLLVKVLKSLSDRGFEKYMDFLKDAYSFCARWIEEDINVYLFNPFSGSTEYAQVAKKQIESILWNLKDGICKSVDAAQETQNNDPIDAFILHLKKHIGKNFSFSDSDYNQIRNQNVTDFENLRILLNRKVESIRKDIESEFIGKTSIMVSKEDVMKKLWGCKEKCPLCLSPCIYTNPDHVKDNIEHECLQHWPPGFGGSYWAKSKKLSTVICSFSITTEFKFHCTASRLKCHEDNVCQAEGPKYAFHPFKDYRKYLKNWSIEADSTGEASRYWQWVMFTYKKELAVFHKTQEPDVPKTWNTDKGAALESLDKLSFEDFTKKRDGERQRDN